MLTKLSLHRPLFLASVTDADEARLALNAGAAIIDCKEPSQGALGALPLARTREVVGIVAGRAPVSATIGDLPSYSAALCAASEATARTGVDVVKVGFFGDGDARAAIAALGRAHLGEARLVAVLMADRTPDFSLIAALADAGFVGVMLDTADKASGALPDVLTGRRLTEFVARAHAHRLMAGLAGSLRLEHVADLAHLGPDILGFRGALCEGGRAGALDAARAKRVGEAVSAAAELRRSPQAAAG
ncbi:MAG: (5-formylfuran-3-yl)methyl phosphate synthase [Hyphomicrobium sp.]